MCVNKKVFLLFLSSLCFLSSYGKIPFGDFINDLDKSERTSLKDYPKSLDTNIEIAKPLGWEEKTTVNPQVVVHYVNIDYMLSFMIQIKELPTFFSRNEILELFQNGNILGMEFDTNKFIEDFIGSNCKFVNKGITEVAQYPAIRVNCFSMQFISGVSVVSYLNVWVVPYEDKLVSFWLSVLNPSNEDLIPSDIFFSTLMSLVRFPELFE